MFGHLENTSASLLSYSMWVNAIAVVYSKYEHVIVIVMLDLQIKTDIFLFMLHGASIHQKKLFAFKSAVTSSQQSYGDLIPAELQSAITSDSRQCRGVDHTIIKR